MDGFVFIDDMPDIKITLTAGPSYFGMLSLAREVAQPLIGVAIGHHPEKLIIENCTNPHQEEGILLEIDHPGNAEIARQLEAAIHQTMMLRPNVTIKVMFSEIDVMIPDATEYLTMAVMQSQKGLRNWGNAVSDQIQMCY